MNFPSTYIRIAALPIRIVHFWRLISAKHQVSGAEAVPNEVRTCPNDPKTGPNRASVFAISGPNVDATCCPANEFPTATAAAMFAAVRKEQVERDLQQKMRAASTASPGAIQCKSLIRKADAAKERKDKGKTAASRGPVPLIMA